MTSQPKMLLLSLMALLSDRNQLVTALARQSSPTELVAA